jgi:hypothetical protein
VGGASANSLAEQQADRPPTPDLESELCSPRTPPRALRVGGGEEEAPPAMFASFFATSSLVPRVEARARCAAASPPERRSQELSGGGCNPVPEPRPASPRLIAGLSSSASAGPIGCTSGLDAFEFGAFELEAFELVALEFSAFDFEVLTDFLGSLGFFAMAGIWDESGRHKRAKPRPGNARWNHGQCD